MNAKKELSIIIPTYNRKEILVSTLHSLQHQKNILWETIEVIIIDDGSSDGTFSEIEKKKNNYPFDLHLFHQENQGQGNARNLALQHAHGDIILFMGDDIIFQQNALEEHVKVHRHYPQDTVACLGYTTWHPDLVVTPFMYFLEHGGPQFNYPKLERTCPVIDTRLGLRRASYWYFYTSNISLKKNILTGEHFEHGYTSYGWEDIDFGYKLSKEKGLDILYNKNAIGYHYHIISDDSFAQRMRSNGKNALLFHQRYPEVPVLPTGIKKVIFQLLALSITLNTLSLLSNMLPSVRYWYYYAQSKRYFFEGIKGV
jgi:glycosyltransferase involved in cell wall biosynthesis